jgi:acetyl esterase/lipase
VIWVHGGAWVSGSKENVGNYLRLLAGANIAMVNVNYTLAPSATHPTPSRQVNAALGWIVANGPASEIDATRIVLAGDSAGSQIATQVAIAQLDPAYAAALGIKAALPVSSLRGLVLFCGAYDARNLNLDGAFGGFLRKILWAYFGQQDFTSAPGFDLFSVAGHLPPAMPPLFISAGNADPLGPQSMELADIADAKVIVTDTLFFPAGYAPPLGHEYQFDLTTEAGQMALARTRAFLATRFSPAAP